MLLFEFSTAKLFSVQDKVFQLDIIKSFIANTFDSFKWLFVILIKVSIWTNERLLLFLFNQGLRR